MTKIATWKFVFICYLRVSFGNTSTIVGPRNTAVNVGERVEMECWADIDSTISEWSVHRPIKEIIFTNWREHKKINNPHFGIIEDTYGSVVLYTNSTELNDAGIYICAAQKELEQPHRLSAQLIVLETKPICETNLSTSGNNTFEEGTLLWMECTVSFRGNWIPTLEWRLYKSKGDVDEEPRDLSDWARDEIVPNANVSSTLTIVLNASSWSSYIWCKIHFKSQSSNQRFRVATANNTPDYNFTWKSPLVTTLPKKVIKTSTQLVHIATEASSNRKTDFTPTLTVIYLVAGVAILFGITGSMAAIILCLRQRRNKSATIAELNPEEPIASQYDLITYGITDGYDSIQEVDEKYDILFPNFPPRQGPLPEQGYSGLMPDVPKPPVVYSRMKQMEKSLEDEVSDVDKSNPKSDIDGSKIDHSKLKDVEEITMKRKLPACSYPVLEPTIGIVENIATDRDSIPYVNRIATNMNNSVQDAGEEQNIPSSYLTTRELDSSLVEK